MDLLNQDRWYIQGTPGWKRGPQIPWVDFNPKEIYCGKNTACGIKLVLAIAASYKLRMRGGDLVGAYLVTRANKDYPVYIKTPKGMEVEDGYCIQAVGNLYGFP